MKRFLDFFLSVTGLLLGFPLAIMLSFLIWLQDKGLVFYFQKRVGLKGEKFRSIQFRSMILRAEEKSGPIQADLNDGRVTCIGRIIRNSAIDALPQLINIAKGDMSFVGPRALRPEEKEVGSGKVVSVFDYPDFKERCKVRPGLTGVAQILLPRDAPREKKFKYDIWYIKNQSFWLDFYLIILSFLVTFQGKWETRKDKLGGLVSNLKCKVESKIG
jgi:lipopolysaccharide/colanic/teichoic acid biosynthesis glycosyltransferase